MLTSEFEGIGFGGPTFKNHNKTLNSLLMQLLRDKHQYERGKKEGNKSFCENNLCIWHQINSRKNGNEINVVPARSKMPDRRLTPFLAVV